MFSFLNKMSFKTSLSKTLPVSLLGTSIYGMENINNNDKVTKSYPIDIIRNKYLLNDILNQLTESKKLELIKYNKTIQKRLEISIKDYKERYKDTIIDITLVDDFMEDNNLYQILNKEKVEKEILKKNKKKNKNIDKNKNENENKIKNEIKNKTKFIVYYYKDGAIKEYKNAYFLPEKPDDNTNITIKIKKNVKNFNNLFKDCTFIKNIVFKRFNRTNIRYMNSMFEGCENVINIDLSKFNTENVKTMKSMFYVCKKLTSLNLFNFNTRKVTNMQNMFYRCSSLENLNLYNFKTENVRWMQNMFWGCSSLTNLNLTNFNTENVNNMSYMFFGCENLTSLNLSNFITNKVTTMENMFCGCSSLKNIDISSFFTYKVSNMGGMFSLCHNLKTLTLNKYFYIKSNCFTFFMFYECENIKFLKFIKPDYYNDGSYSEEKIPIDNKASNNIVEKIKKYQD